MGKALKVERKVRGGGGRLVFEEQHLEHRPARNRNMEFKWGVQSARNLNDK